MTELHEWNDEGPAMERGPMPPVPIRLEHVAAEADQLDAGSAAATTPSSMPTSAEGVGVIPTPAPAIEADPTAAAGLPDSSECPADPPTSPVISADAPAIPAEPEAVRAVRLNYERIGRELAAARAELPGLADAERLARDLSRERAIESKIRGDAESAQHAQQARELYGRAAQRHAEAAAEVDALHVAWQRVGRSLEAAVAAAAQADEKLVRDFVLSPAEVERVDAMLLEAIDALFLRCRMKGIHSTAQAMVSNVLGIKLDGGALLARSSERFARILRERKAVMP